MAADLRSFLAVLDDNGLLVRIEKPVNAATQAGRLMRQLELRGVAGLFTNIDGADAALTYNLIGSRAALALALGVEADEVRTKFRRAFAHRIEPVLIDGAPSQEVIRHGDEIDLRRLPLVTHSARDAGPYITAGAVIAHDPASGARNVSINRMMIAGAAETGIRMMPPQQLGVIQANAEAEGADLQVAVAIGLHPTDTLAAGTSLPHGEDEFALAGGLRGEPLRLTRAASVDVDVPADAEIVIEGVIPAGVREPEGPFGDFLEFYVPEMPNHRLRVTAVTHRRDPILQTMVAGSREDTNLLGLSREVEVESALERVGTRVIDVRVGPTILTCAIAIDARYPGEAKNVGLAALGAYPWLKYCVVVDSDVDVHSSDDVWWAIANRSSPERAIVIAHGAPAFPRDAHGIHGSRAVIDATIPFGTWDHYERRVPPGGAPLDLDDWLR